MKVHLLAKGKILIETQSLTTANAIFEFCNEHKAVENPLFVECGNLYQIEVTPSDANFRDFITNLFSMSLVK